MEERIAQRMWKEVAEVVVQGSGVLVTGTVSDKGRKGTHSFEVN